MDKEKPKTQDEDKRLATDAQIRLAGQLERELDYAEAVPDDVLHTQTRSVVSEYIHKLKELKVRDQALRAQNQRVTGFRDISFGMIYKMCWNALKATDTERRLIDVEFMEIVLHEYELYKGTRAYVKEHIERGGSP